MSLLCLAGKHVARTGETWNQGLYFSRCRRCGCDMVRADKVWETVPPGFRIVWRPVERPEQAGPTQVSRNLPIVILQGPRQRPPESAPLLVLRHHPRRPFGLLQLLFVGAELLVVYGADNFRKWRKNLAARRLQRPAVLLLPAG
jgi:hypothetical protein